MNPNGSKPMSQDDFAEICKENLFLNNMSMKIAILFQIALTITCLGYLYKIDTIIAFEKRLSLVEAHHRNLEKQPLSTEKGLTITEEKHQNNSNEQENSGDKNWQESIDTAAIKTFCDRLNRSQLLSKSGITDEQMNAVQYILQSHQATSLTAIFSKNQNKAKVIFDFANNITHLQKFSDQFCKYDNLLDDGQHVEFEIQTPAMLNETFWKKTSEKTWKLITEVTRSRK